MLRRKSWAVCLVLFALVVGCIADSIGDCGLEEFGGVGADVMCLHSESDDCDSPAPAGGGHHHGTHCLCPCHGLTIAPPAQAAPALAPLAFVNQHLSAGLATVDLPSPLRPPIDAV